MNNCEKCAFNNPIEATTAIIIKNNAVLLLRRNEEPFKGFLDFPGGYVNADEHPIEAAQREITEELGWPKKYDLVPIGIFPGHASWKNHNFSVNILAFLKEPDKNIKLNNENSEYIWLPLKDLDPAKIAFDGNQIIAVHIKNLFTIDIPRADRLIKQLDPTASFNEQKFYLTQLNGYVHREYNENKELIGFGSIFPRQTMLRKTAVIEDVVVEESARGQGIGAKIMNALEERAKDIDIEIIEMTSGYHRKAAHELYKNLGYNIHETAHLLKKIV